MSENHQHAGPDPLRYFDDDTINELLIDGCKSVWLVRKDGKEREQSPFDTQKDVVGWIIKLARSNHIRLDPTVGAAGGTLQDGAFRWHCLLSPMAVDGPLVSIRRHRFQSINISDFSMSGMHLSELKDAVEQRRHIIIAGPTGSGKTSLLAALIKLMPVNERIFVIESISELGAVMPGVIRLSPRHENLEQQGGFSFSRLLGESLRLLPDRIIVGEVRSIEAPVLVDALRTGHRGVMATIHASSRQDVVARMASLSGASLPSLEDTLAKDLLIVSMQRGNPPAVRHLERLS